MRRNGHAISDSHIYDGISDAFHDAQRFVSDHETFATPEPPLVNMQVGSADRGRSQLEEHVGWGLDRWFVDGFDANLSRLVEHDRFH